MEDREKKTVKSKLPRRMLTVGGVLIAILLVLLLVLTGKTSNEKQVKARYTGQTYAKEETNYQTDKRYEDFAVADAATNGIGGLKSESAVTMASSMSFEDSITNDVQMDVDLETSSGQQTPAHGKKIAYTYDYTVESTDFDAFLQDLNSTLDQLDGYLESSRVDRKEHDRLDGAGVLSLRRGNYSIRVPAGKVNEVIKLFSTENAQTTYENVRMLDKTAAYVDAETQLASYQREYQKLEALLDDAESVSDTIQIQDRLSSLNYQIEWAKKQMALIDEDVDYSTITLELYEVIYYTASIEAYKYELGEDLAWAFREFIYGMPKFLFVMIYLLIGIVMVTGTVSTIVSVVVRRFEKKRGDRVLRIVDGREIKRVGTKESEQEG